MADNSSGGGNAGIIVFMMMVMVGAGVGFWYFKRNKSNISEPIYPFTSTTTDPITGLPAGINPATGQVMKLDPSYDGWYQTVEFTAGGPTPSVLDTSIRAGVPITSGSKRGYDITRFDKTAKGTCQCNDTACCYKSIFQPKHGDTDSEKICDDVHYGDYLDTCDNLVRKFEDRVFFAKAFTASIGQKAGANDYRNLLNKNRIRNIRS